MELVVDKAPEVTNSRTGYHVALGFGQAMNAVNGSDHGGLGFDQYLKEAYFSYLAPVGKGLQVDIGKFVTPHGAEVIETKDNWNYSRGLLFSYAIPYYHFGMRAKYAFNDKYSLSGFFVNGWNNVVDNNTGKTYGVSFGWNPNKKFGIVAELHGRSRREQSQQRCAPAQRHGHHLFAHQQAVVHREWRLRKRRPHHRSCDEHLFPSGVLDGRRWLRQVCLQRHLGHHHALRVLRRSDGFTTGTLVPTHFNEFTATFERLMAHHIISRFEFRRDMSNQPVFLKGSNPVLAQNTLTAGLVFTFDSREAKVRIWSSSGQFL